MNIQRSILPNTNNYVNIGPMHNNSMSSHRSNMTKFDIENDMLSGPNPDNNTKRNESLHSFNISTVNNANTLTYNRMPHIANKYISNKIHEVYGNISM